MNVLITGVNGLVGKSVAQRLSKTNNVIGLSRAVENKTELPIDYCSVDLSKSDTLSALCEKKIDEIVHCAASLSNDPLSEELVLSNCVALRNIASFATNVECKQFVYISSIPIIGTPIDIPITEEHPVHPVTAYHATKYFGELYFPNVLKDCSFASLRIPSPIGAGLSENKIVPVFIKKSINGEDIVMLGSGKRVQNYIDVKDIAVAVDLAIEKKANGIYNIAAEKSYSNKELAELCIKLFDSKSKIVYKGEDPAEKYKWIISIEKAKKELGFNPATSLETSIKEIAKEHENFIH